MEWQIAKLIIIAIISLTAFVVVTIIAIPAWVAMYRSFQAWRQGRHFSRRYKRDPEFRRRVDVAGKYEVHLGTLVHCRATLNALGRDMPQDDGPMSGLRRHRYDKVATDFSRIRDLSAAYLKDLPDEDIPILAEYINKEWFDGRAPQEEIEEFLRQERELVGRAPALIVEHLERALKRFAKYSPVCPEQTRTPD